MKRLLLIGALLLCCNVMVEAQPRFRTAIFADTDDPDIGNGVRRSLDYVNIMLGEIAASIDIVPEKEDVFPGDECRKATLLKWLRSLECNDDDIIVFCYLGHGTRSFNDTSIFPQMCLGGDRDSDFVSLEAVKNAIMEKGPRFALIIGDCCNSKDPNVSPKFTLLNAAGNSSFGEMEQKNLKKLFLEQRGCVITTGSRPGEYSWANNSPYQPYQEVKKNDNERPKGLYYTTYFTELFPDYVAKTSNSDCSWNDFLESLANTVGEISIICSKDKRTYHQHPIYRVLDGTKKHNPHPKTNDTPRISSIKDQLIQIADDRNDSYDRISQAESLGRRSFTRDAVVKVVGRDNQTVLSIETAEDYLTRISTSRRLRGIVVLNEEKDAQGMISKLTVHEIYYRKNNQ